MQLEHLRVMTGRKLIAEVDEAEFGKKLLDRIAMEIGGKGGREDNITWLEMRNWQWLFFRKGGRGVIF